MADLDTAPHSTRAFLRSVLLAQVQPILDMRLVRAWSQAASNRDALLSLYGSGEPEAERDVGGAQRGEMSAEQVFAVRVLQRVSVDTSLGPVSDVAAEQDRVIDDLRVALHAYDGGEMFQGNGYWIETGRIEERSTMADIDEDGAAGYTTVVGVLQYTQTWG